MEKQTEQIKETTDDYMDFTDMGFNEDDDQEDGLGILPTNTMGIEMPVMDMSHLPSF